MSSKKARTSIYPRIATDLNPHITHEILEYLCIWDIAAVGLTGSKVWYEAYSEWCFARTKHKTTLDYVCSLKDNVASSDILPVFEADVFIPCNVKNAVSCITHGNRIGNDSTDSNNLPTNTSIIRMWDIKHGNLKAIGCRRFIEDETSLFLGLRTVEEQGQMVFFKFSAVAKLEPSDEVSLKIEDASGTEIVISKSFQSHGKRVEEVKRVYVKCDVALLERNFLVSQDGQMFAIIQQPQNGDSEVIIKTQNGHSVNLKMPGKARFIHGQHASSQHWSPDLSRFVILTELPKGGSVFWVWDTQGGLLIQKISLPSFLDHYYLTCKFSSNGQFLFVNPTGYSVFALFSISSGKIIFKHKCFEHNLISYPKSEEDPFESAELSPDGAVIMVLESDKKCCQTLVRGIEKLQTQKSENNPPHLHSGKRIVFYDVNSGRAVGQHKFKQQVGGCTFGPNGQTVMVWPFEDLPESGLWFQVWKLS